MKLSPLRLKTKKNMREKISESLKFPVVLRKMDNKNFKEWTMKILHVVEKDPATNNIAFSHLPTKRFQPIISILEQYHIIALALC